MDRKTEKALLQDMLDSTEQIFKSKSVLEAIEIGKIALKDAESKHKQRQAILTYQFEALYAIANAFGLYDAADWIKATLGGRDYGVD